MARSIASHPWTSDSSWSCRSSVIRSGLWSGGGFSPGTGSEVSRHPTEGYSGTPSSHAVLDLVGVDGGCCFGVRGLYDVENPSRSEVRKYPAADPGERAWY